MTKQPDHYQEGVSIGEEGRKVREKFKKLKRSKQHAERKEVDKLAAAGRPLKPIISPEHYHVVYQYEDRAVVHFAAVYPSVRTAYLEVKRLGDEAEPNTEWYDDGRVMIETPIHGQSGLHRIVLRVTACMNTNCGKTASPLILPASARSRPTGMLGLPGGKS